MNVTAEKSAMRLKGSAQFWAYPFRHKLRMREARKIMAMEEKDASKIGRMEGSEEDNGKVSQDRKRLPRRPLPHGCFLNLYSDYS